MAQYQNIAIHCGDYLEVRDHQGHYFLIDALSWQMIKDYYWLVHDKTHGHHQQKQVEVVAHSYNNNKHIIIKLHRLLMSPSKVQQVDHINGNPLDNRISNLRLCTNQENAFNSRSKGGVSKYKGVTWCKETNRWRANIMLNRKNIHIGRYDTELEAARAYDQASKEYHGNFGKTNKELGLL